MTPNPPASEAGAGAGAGAAPAGGSPGNPLPALRTHPKFVFFTDFDGTITQQDSNDFLTDTLGFGAERRAASNADVLHGRRHFRDSFREMIDSVAARAPFGKCIDALLAHVTLDPHFGEFLEWAKLENVPVVVLSGGMRPIIEALLANLLPGGEAAVRELQIVSSDVEVRPGFRSIDEVGGWQIVYHDDR